MKNNNKSLSFCFCFLINYILHYWVTVIDHTASLVVDRLAASEPNKPRNFLWLADSNINASLYLELFFSNLWQQPKLKRFSFREMALTIFLFSRRCQRHLLTKNFNFFKRFDLKMMSPWLSKFWPRFRSIMFDGISVEGQTL